MQLQQKHPSPGTVNRIGILRDDQFGSAVEVWRRIDLGFFLAASHLPSTVGDIICVYHIEMARIDTRTNFIFQVSYLLARIEIYVGTSHLILPDE